MLCARAMREGGQGMMIESCQGVEQDHHDVAWKKIAQKSAGGTYTLQQSYAFGALLYGYVCHN